ncbi:DUF3800 domain-containing protein [Erwinia sp. STN24]|uniref:DUF3800 domain-containing protein n=1 Tax=Erwinia sp. STN24 TaxID=3233996 RepID=UPI003521E875
MSVLLEVKNQNAIIFISIRSFQFQGNEMVKTVYFDESGFTGNNLLSRDQPFFSYAAVVSDEEESKAFVERIIDKYKISAGELKGSTLVNSKRLQKAVDEILTHYRGRMRVVVNEKKYALSGKFFEYVFEPVLAAKSSIFYNLNFHRFISNMMYFSMIANDGYSNELHNRFEDFSRRNISVDQFLQPVADSKYSDFMKDIHDFARIHIDIIQEEYNGSEGTGIEKWMLDLTTTSLYNLLCDVSVKFGKIRAICDESKPLISNQEMFNKMVGSEKIAYQSFDGKNLPFTFMLSEPLILADSKKAYGIQIADIVAAMSNYLMKKKNHSESFHKKWINIFEKEVFYWQCCVVPTPELLDPSNSKSHLNRYILEEITSRSRNSLSVLDGIEQEIYRISRALTFI